MKTNHSLAIKEKFVLKMVSDRRPPAAGRRPPTAVRAGSQPFVNGFSQTFFCLIGLTEISVRSVVSRQSPSSWRISKINTILFCCISWKTHVLGFKLVRVCTQLYMMTSQFWKIKLNVKSAFAMGLRSLHAPNWVCFEMPFLCLFVTVCLSFFLQFSI